MKKLTKRIMALMLSLVMILGIMPSNTFAEGVFYTFELEDVVTGEYVDAWNVRGPVGIDVFKNGLLTSPSYDSSFMYPNYNDLVPGKEELCVIGPIVLDKDIDVKYKSCDLYSYDSGITSSLTAQQYYNAHIDSLEIGAFSYTTDSDQDVDCYIVIPVTSRVTKELDKHTLGQIDALADLYNLDHKDAEEFVASLVSYYDFKGDKEFLLDFYKTLYGCLFFNSLEYDDIAGVLSETRTDLMTTDEKELDKKAKLFTMFLSFSELRNLEGTSNGVVGELKSNSIHSFIGSILDEVADEKGEGYVDGTIFNTFTTKFKNLYDAYLALCTDPDNYASPIAKTLHHLYLEDLNRTPLFDGEVDRFSKYMESMLYEWITHGKNDCPIDDLTYCLSLSKACDEEIKKWAEENTSFDEMMKQINDSDGAYANKIFEELSTLDPTPSRERDEALWRMITRFVSDMELLAESCLYDNDIEEYEACLKSQVLYDDLGKLIEVIASNEKENYKDFSSLEQCILEIVPDFINGYSRIIKEDTADMFISNHYREVRQKLKDEVTPKSSSKTYKAKDTNNAAEKISGSGKKGSKRTITPQDGRKVSSVIVTDKNGNRVDVTKNADGTYSFVQPASDVNIEVNYKNREITLNIGSTEASVDGEQSSLDAAPVIRNDRTMLPIRFVAENLGAKVEWNEKNPNYVLITKGDIKIEITLGSDKMLVNGKEVKLDSVAFAENDRTYLPVRAVSENLNAIVEWNEAKPMEVKIYER